MPEPLNFQSIIMSLQNYWAEQGCLIWQPYYTQVGAGTMNPATILRVLQPPPSHVHRFAQPLRRLAASALRHPAARWSRPPGPPGARRRPAWAGRSRGRPRA